MKQLEKIDLNRCVARLPIRIVEMLKSNAYRTGDNGVDKVGIFLGGGFIRETIAGNAPVDIDLFGQSEEQLRRLAWSLRPADGHVHVTDNALTVLNPPRLPVQFITRWLFNNPLKLIESFDFTVCQAAIWYENGVFVSACADNFYSDLAARRLSYTSPMREEEPGGSMMRVIKFIKRGYTITPSSLSRVMARCAGAVRDWEGKTEIERGKIIAGELYEVDPLAVVDGLEIVNDAAN